MCFSQTRIVINASNYIYDAVFKHQCQKCILSQHNNQQNDISRIIFKANDAPLPWHDAPLPWNVLPNSATYIILKNCVTNSIQKMRANLSRIYKKANLVELKLVGIAVEVEMVAVGELLDTRKIKHSTNIATNSFENCYLTEDKETMVVHVANLIVGMGMGINKDICLEIIFTVMSCRISSNDIDKPMIRVLNCILNMNKSLLKLINGNAIDPARVRKANKNIRNSVFIKKDNYIKLLHSMEKVPWRSFDEVPQQNIYNMDEIAIDSSGHPQQIVGQYGSLGQAFQITLEGEVRMPFHITICISSCAIGIYSFPSGKVKGALPPLIIHSDNWKENTGEKDNVDPKKTASKIFYQNPMYSEGLGENNKENEKKCK